MNAKIEKLLRLALDPAATAGEAYNCLSAVRTLTGGFDGLVKEFRLLSTAEPRRPQPRHSYNPAEDTTMPFGKFEGETIMDIARENPGYLRWCLKNIESLDDELRAVIQEGLRRR